jgi:hypothetical protein
MSDSQSCLQHQSISRWVVTWHLSRDRTRQHHTGHTLPGTQRCPDQATEYGEQTQCGCCVYTWSRSSWAHPGSQSIQSSVILSRYWPCLHFSKPVGSVSKAKTDNGMQLGVDKQNSVPFRNEFDKVSKTRLAHWSPATDFDSLDYN